MGHKTGDGQIVSEATLLLPHSLQENNGVNTGKNICPLIIAPLLNVIVVGHKTVTQLPNSSVLNSSDMAGSFGFLLNPIKEIHRSPCLKAT